MNLRITLHGISKGPLPLPPETNNQTKEHNQNLWVKGGVDMKIS